LSGKLQLFIEFFALIISVLYFHGYWIVDCQSLTDPVEKYCLYENKNANYRSGFIQDSNSQRS